MGPKFLFSQWISCKYRSPHPTKLVGTEAKPNRENRLLNAVKSADREKGDGAIVARNWVAEHGDYLFRYALSKVRDRDRAEDLIQETFLAAWRARTSYTGKASVRTWLTAILNRKIIDAYRQRLRERPVTEQDEDRFAFDPFSRRGKWKVPPRNWTADPSANLTRDEFWVAFSACLAKLPSRLHDTFVLRYLDDASGDDVMRELGLSTSNLSVMLHRARIQMWTCLSKTWFEREAPTC